MSAQRLVLVSGVANDAYSFIKAVDNILVSVYGWELVRRDLDANNDRSYWWRSEGEVKDKWMPLYCGLYADGGILRVFSASYKNPDTGAASDTMNSFFDTRIEDVNTQFNFWVSGNKDVVYLATQNNILRQHSLGFGYLNTFYPYKEDPYPAFIFGQRFTPDKFSDGDRIMAYTANRVYPRGGVSDGPFLTASSSGITGFYAAAHYSGLCSYAAPSPYDGRYAAFQPILYRTLSTSLKTNEVRGTFQNMWQIHGDVFTQGDIVAASGILTDVDTLVEDAKFVVYAENGTTDNTYIIGPILDFDSTQSLSYAYTFNSTFLELYLTADRGIERRGGSFRGGRVSSWRDRHIHPSDEVSGLDARNDAAQVTEANQPVPVEDVINNLPVVRFSSADSMYLTGEMDTDNDMTIIAVASYSSGSSRAPIFNVRGSAGGVDTLFSLEFNENSNDSATAVHIAGGGTNRVEYTGLSSGTPYILTTTVSGTDTSLYVNGFSGGSSVVDNSKGTAAAGTDLTYSLGVDLTSGGSVGTFFGDLDLAELLVYKKVLTNEQLQSIWCSLSERYNVAVSGTCP